jgi:NAD(P)-dependent dehydrogenase (short-subunit alcohol dehydrogenase family)
MSNEYAKFTTVDRCFRSMKQFISLQYEQEKTTQKLIGIQEQLIAKVLQGIPAPHKTRSNRLPSLPASAPDGSLAVDPVKRYILKTVADGIAKGSSHFELQPDRAVLVLEKSPSYFPVIEKVLSNLPNPVWHVVPAAQSPISPNNCVLVDFSSLENIQRLRDMIVQKTGGICAVFNMLALTSAVRNGRFTDPLMAGDYNNSPDPGGNGIEPLSDDEELNDARYLFLLLKVCLPDLKNSAQSGGAWLINLSFMDGHFGLGRKMPFFSLGQAGSVGVVKAVGRESPRIRVKCVDVNPEVSAVYLIRRLKQELLAFDDSVEVGLDGSNRWKLDTLETPASVESQRAVDLNTESVVLATGGGYGIVAEILKAMARRYGCRIVIVGRSPFPEPESDATRHLATQKLLRNYLIAASKRSNQPQTPAQILASENKILKTRQIHANLAAMQRYSAGVEYHSIDIRNADQFGDFIDRIYKKYGRLDGVVHGAGVIDDKPVERKSSESFNRVFNTKVVSAMVLARKLRPRRLKFLCFFSSVAARFGNRGQADYCAANEILNKLAHRLDVQWDARVFAINWGPWDTGMVGADLRAAFTQRGLSLIPVAQGVHFFLNELERSTDTAPEVMITRKLSF